MLTQERWHQWETNSSSVHKIVISNEGTICIPSIVEIYAGEYGWGFDVLRSVEDRISYIVTLLAVCAKTTEEFEEHYGKLVDFLSSKGVDIVDNRIRDKDVISTEPGAKYYCEGNIMGIPGYIDHDSTDNIHDVLEMLDDDEKLSNFLFGGKSMVLIGNDNEETIFNFDVKKAQETEEW